MVQAGNAVGLFKSKLKVEDLNGGREWILLEDLVYETSRGERVTAPAPKSGRDFWVWNGASIPRFLWRVFGSPFVGKHRKPSVLHDYLCSMAEKDAKEDLGKMSFTYRRANWVFYDSMIACGEWRWLAWLKWLGTAFKASYQKGGWK